MQLNKIIEDYVVSEQITPDDIDTIRRQGLKPYFVTGPTMKKIIK